DLGEQQVAEPGDAPADHDHRRVDEADQRGEDLPDPVAAVPDQVDARDVAAGCALRDVHRGEEALRGEAFGQRRRLPRTGGGGRVPGEGHTAEEGLQAAGLAARAGRSLGLDLDVADVARGSLRPSVDVAVDLDAAA